MRKIKSKEMPERLNPGDNEPLRCAPGSIEQQLDMCETGDLRGDEIQFHHGLEDTEEGSEDPAELDDLLTNFHVDMSEENREGSEDSGDEHSAGIQGDKDEPPPEERP